MIILVLVTLLGIKSSVSLKGATGSFQAPDQMPESPATRVSHSRPCQGPCWEQCREECDPGGSSSSCGYKSTCGKRALLGVIHKQIAVGFAFRGHVPLVPMPTALACSPQNLPQLSTQGLPSPFPRAFSIRHFSRQHWMGTLTHERILSPPSFSFPVSLS